MKILKLQYIIFKLIETIIFKHHRDIRSKILSLK